MNKLRLLQDIFAGLLSLTVLQWKTIQAWAMKNPDGILLAVGDVFPLLLAWMASRQTRKVYKGNAGSGIKFIFVGAAKSEYYIRDDDNLPHKLGFFDYLASYWFSRSVYFPWERAMMADSNCCLVVPRDSITAATLKKALPESAEEKVKYMGNPMMDNLKPSGALKFLKKQMPSLCVALLPGSRAPEVYFNWKTILDAVENLLLAPISDQITFLVPIFPSLEMVHFSKTLLSMGWKFAASEGILHDIEDSIFLADAAIAMAGTATEQIVGLGKPVFILPGNGPQFTNRFANAQSRLLGKSVIMCSRWSIGAEMGEILRKERNVDVFKENGQKRMGAPGASRRIARQIHHRIWH